MSTLVFNLTALGAFGQGLSSVLSLQFAGASSSIGTAVSGGFTESPAGVYAWTGTVPAGATSVTLLGAYNQVLLTLDGLGGAESSSSSASGSLGDLTYDGASTATFTPSGAPLSSATLTITSLSGGTPLFGPTTLTESGTGSGAGDIGTDGYGGNIGTDGYTSGISGGGSGSSPVATWAGVSLAAGTYQAIVSWVSNGQTLYEVFDLATATETVAPVVYTDTASPATPDGTYNVDGPQTNYLLTLEDVYDVTFGIDYHILQRAISQKQGYAITNVNDWITKRVIPAVESQVEGIVHQSLRPTQETMFFDGTGTNEMWLPYRPVISIDTCQINVIPSMEWINFQHIRFVQGLGDIDYNTQYMDADLMYDPTTGHIVIPYRVLYAENTAIPFWDYTFLSGNKNIQVTWTYGYQSPSDVPERLRYAASLLAGCRVLKLAGMIQGEGVAIYKSQNIERDYGRTKNLPYSDLIADMTKEAMDILKNYKRTFA